MRELFVAGRRVADVEMAVTPRTRGKGLLGRTGLSGALWLAPARQVHTYRMKFAIDVAHVDRNGTVIHTQTMPPGRLGPWKRRARGVLEAEAGSFEAWGLTPGVQVELVAPAMSA